MAFRIGVHVQLTATLTDIHGDLADDATILLKIKNPAGGTTIHAAGALTHPSTGVYGYQLALDDTGPWWWRFETSSIPAVAEGQIDVTPSMLT